MVFLLLLSLGVGYLLNEEQALRRICRNLSYPHEGWLVMHNQQALWVIGACFLLAFAKAVIWGWLVLATWPAWLHHVMLFYCLGNIVAARLANGLYFTPWLALLGWGVVLDPSLFQLPFAFLCVGWMLSRRWSVGLDAAMLAAVVSLCLLGTGSEIILGLGGIVLTWYFSGRQTPFFARLIKYR